MLLMEHPGGGGVGVDDLPLAGEGHHAVGHVEEQGVQLVALVLHLAQGVCSCPAMSLKVSVSTPISSWEATSILWEKSPGPPA